MNFIKKLFGSSPRKELTLDDIKDGIQVLHNELEALLAKDATLAQVALDDLEAIGEIPEMLDPDESIDHLRISQIILSRAQVMKLRPSQRVNDILSDEMARKAEQVASRFLELAGRLEAFGQALKNL